MIEAWVDVMIKVCRCYDRSVCCGIIVIAMNRMSVSSMPMVCPIEMGIPAGLRLISVLSFVLRISSLDSGIRFPYICNRPPWLTDDLQVTYRWLAGDLQITYRWLTGDLQITHGLYPFQWWRSLLTTPQVRDITAGLRLKRVRDITAGL